MIKIRKIQLLLMLYLISMLCLLQSIVKRIIAFHVDCHYLRMDCHVKRKKRIAYALIKLAYIGFDNIIYLYEIIEFTKNVNYDKFLNAML